MDHLSVEEISDKIKRAEKLVKVGAKYRHFKGEEYRVREIALHSETLEEMVIYEPLYKTGAKFWVRPLDNFLEKIIVAGKKIPRFERMEN